MDNLFADNGDSGFWSSLHQLSKKSKCPIVITSTSLPPSLTLALSNFGHGELSLPRPMECAKQLEEIAAQEGFSIICKSNLKTIAELMRCDMRKILLELQCWALIRNRVNEVPVPELTTITGVRQSYEVNPPRVKTIFPEILSSTRYSTIEIQGEFSRPPQTRIEVTLDSKPVIFQELSKSTLIAIISPPVLPEGVNHHGACADTLLHSVSCRYPQLEVKFLQENGIAVRNQEFIRLEYMFPPLESLDLSYCSKKLDHVHTHENILLKNEKKRIHLSSTNENELKFDDKEQLAVEKEKNRSKKIKLTKDYQTQFSQNCLERMLKEAVNEYSALNKEFSGSKIVTLPNECVETSNCSRENSIHQLREMEELENRCSSLSDAIFLEDFLESFDLPFVSGPVQGFGNRTRDCSQLQTGKLGEDQKAVSSHTL